MIKLGIHTVVMWLFISYIYIYLSNAEHSDGLQALVYYLNGVIDVRKWMWLHSTCNPAEVGRKKPLSSKHLTWIFLWGFDHPPYEGQRTTRAPQRHSSLFGNTRILHLPAAWDSIKMGMFFFLMCVCFRHCDGCQDLQGLTGKEWETFGCVWVGCSQKTNRISVYLWGHPQIPVGDVLTELPTNLDVDRRGKKRAKEKKRKLFAQSTDDRVLKNLLILCLAFSK